MAVVRFALLLRDQRSLNLGHLGTLGLVEHRQQDHSPRRCEPVGNPDLLSLQMKPELTDLATEMTRVRLAECPGVVDQQVGVELSTAVVMIR